MNAEANSGNRITVLASNNTTRIFGCHAALRECIMYKQLNYTPTLIPSDSREAMQRWLCAFFWWFCMVANRQKSIQFFFQEPP